MDRQFYLDLAGAGLRMPIGTHLVLHEHPDREAILRDGRRLAAVVREAALRFQTPLAIPLMDLTLEKAALLKAAGIVEGETEAYHFVEPLTSEPLFQLTPKMAATCQALGYLAGQNDLLPVGMTIGPFSLTTKLMSDPITPVFLAGTGSTPSQEPEINLLEHLLSLATDMILYYVEAQIEAGAKALIVCEPAASIAFFSPNQLARSFGLFERLVMEPNRRIKALLADRGVDLLFHDCGELVEGMIRRFATLDPALLSLGSSRRLWEDATLVPKSTVLYGNLPTKRFYSDALLSLDEVRRLSSELLERMRGAQHPFILGSECDVLSVPGSEQTINAKVEAFLQRN